MSCPYYHWNQGFACQKSGKGVNEDIYYKYCRDYNYSSCPIYKWEESANGCFLTSACVGVMGLPDDCFELTVLRSFRDTYLHNCINGIQEINEYYFIAPQVIARIYAEKDATKTLKLIYEELIIPCVDLICSGQYEVAHIKYRNYILRLSEQFGI